MPISKPVLVFYPLNLVFPQHHPSLKIKYNIIYVTRLNWIPGNFNVNYFTYTHMRVFFIVKQQQLAALTHHPKLWHGYQHQYHHREVVGPKGIHQGLK